MLERDGLVELIPYRGARVTTLTEKEIEESYFIRGHLESIATGLAAERITEAELTTLDELMARMREAVQSQDGPRFSDRNHEFHETIVAACGNDMLRELTMDVWQRHSGFQRVFRMVPERLAPSQEEHKGIMNALRATDAKRAATLPLWHKRSVGDTVAACSRIWSTQGWSTRKRSCHRRRDADRGTGAAVGRGVTACDRRPRSRTCATRC
jgi:DNA-binding GntR family transcriptional regulator